MKEVKELYIFKNGNLAVFDYNNKQIPVLQFNIISLLKEKALKSNCVINDNTKISMQERDD